MNINTNVIMANAFFKFKYILLKQAYLSFISPCQNVTIKQQLTQNKARHIKMEHEIYEEHLHVLLPIIISLQVSMSTH